MSSIWIVPAVLVMVANLVLFRLHRKLRRRRIREQVVAEVRMAIGPWLKPELAVPPPPKAEPPTPGADRHRLVLGTKNDEPSSPRHKWVS